MIQELKELVSLEVVSEFISGFPKVRGFRPELVNSGVSTAVYRLRGENAVYYLRLPNKGENMSSEALAHRLMLAKGVSVPQIIATGDGNGPSGRSFMITSEIPGIKADSDPEATGETYFAAGKQLAIINSIPVERFGWIDREKMNVKNLSGTYDTWEEFTFDLPKLKAQLDKIVSRGILNSSRASDIFEHLESSRRLITCPQANLSHGDFAVSHIFTVHGKYSGIIDFGDIRCCSSFHDLAHFYCYSPKQFPDLLRGYLTEKDLGDDVMAKVKVEALIIGIGKLNWMIEFLPHKLTPNHTMAKFLENF